MHVFSKIGASSEESYTFTNERVRDQSAQLRSLIIDFVVGNLKCPIIRAVMHINSNLWRVRGTVRADFSFSCSHTS